MWLKTKEKGLLPEYIENVFKITSLCKKIQGFQDARNPQQPMPYQTALKNDFIASVDVLCNVFKSTGYDV